LIIGGAAVTSLLVHYAIISHTAWYPAYWNGSYNKKVAMDSSSTAVSAAQTAPAFTVSVAPVAAPDGKADTSFVVTVTPNKPAPVTVGDAGSPPTN
jgi:light-harvesting protein B-800-850 alpha chain